MAAAATAPGGNGPYLALAPQCVLKRLETPCLYDIGNDQLYELDERAAAFLASSPSAAAADSDPEAAALVGFCRREGLVVEAETPAPVSLPAAPPLRPSLRYLLLHVTDRCTLRCRHCFLGDPSGRDLPLEDILRAAGEFAGLQGLRCIVSGGEPLLHPDFGRLNERLPAFPFRAVLLSNGTLIDRGVAAALNFHEVQISLDGPEDAHDLLRGRGSYRRAVAALRALADAGKAISVATVVHAGNQDRIDELAAGLEEFPLRGWSVDVPCAAGAMRRHPELMPDPARASLLMNRSFGGGLYGSGAGWACGAHLAAVMPDGTIDKCGYFTAWRSGHVREGLAAAWARIPRWRLAELACRCSHLEECRGGCRFRAQCHGDLRGPDPAMCLARAVPVGGDR